MRAAVRTDVGALDIDHLSTRKGLPQSALARSHGKKGVSRGAATRSPRRGRRHPPLPPHPGKRRLHQRPNPRRRARAPPDPAPGADNGAGKHRQPDARYHHRSKDAAALRGQGTRPTSSFRQKAAPRMAGTCLFITRVATGGTTSPCSLRRTPQTPRAGHLATRRGRGCRTPRSPPARRP
jgi:hypothetical protein